MTAAVLAPEAGTATMVDLSFAVSAPALPADHRGALWQALAAALPWLADTPGAGIHPLKAMRSADGAPLLLARRARLLVRLPATRADAAAVLAGTTLDLGDAPLSLGDVHVRDLVPANTLYAETVAGEYVDEIAFTLQLERALDALGVQARIICGRAQRLSCTVSTARGRITRELAGYPVALHGLRPEASLRAQNAGLGDARQFGCGIFVPHKAITGLD